MKKNKQAYYNKYFETNGNNIKNTRKGITFLVSLKTVASRVPTVLSLHNGNTLTNPYDIANTFNNYFLSIAETTKNNIKYLHEHLKNECDSTMFLQLTSKEEIASIISSLNSKGSVPNSIPCRIIFLLEDEVSKQSAETYNLVSGSIILYLMP